jgi:hypothetical protein
MWNSGKAYFFKGQDYARLDLSTKRKDDNYPRSIANNWPGLWSSDIDAVTMWDNGKAYFFKGSQYTRVDLATKKADDNYPRSIKGNWCGLYGGAFGNPDVHIAYRQKANFHVFDKGEGNTTGAGNGMFILYTIEGAVNHRDIGSNFNYQLAKISASKPDEVSGNTTLDTFIKSAPDSATVPGGEDPTQIGGRIVIRVEGDPLSLKTKLVPLHYCDQAGWAVEMGRNTAFPQDPIFGDPMTKALASSL